MKKHIALALVVGGLGATACKKSNEGSPPPDKGSATTPDKGSAGSGSGSAGVAANKDDALIAEAISLR